MPRRKNFGVYMNMSRSCLIQEIHPAGIQFCHDYRQVTDMRSKSTDGSRPACLGCANLAGTAVGIIFRCSHSHDKASC